MRLVGASAPAVREAALASHRLSPEAQRKLATVLADARLRGEEILEELRGIRDGEGVPAFAATVETLARVRMAERDAESVLLAILRHREQLHSSLGRDPGLQVAAEDYFTTPRPMDAGVDPASATATRGYADRDTLDPVSGLIGSETFRNELRRELRRSLRHGLEFALLRIDVGGILSLRGSHENRFCDGALRAVGQALRRTLRDADRAARLSESEIAVVLIGTDRMGAQAAAERLLESIARAFSGVEPAGTPRRNDLAAGIACFPSDGQTVQALEARAAEALGRARRAAGIRVEAHHAERRAHARRPASGGFAVEMRPPGERAEWRVGDVLNLSRSGALVKARGPHRSQERFDLVFVPPREAEVPARWTASGRVVRIDALPVPEGGQFVAIAFDELLPEEWIARSTNAPGPPPGSRMTR